MSLRRAQRAVRNMGGFAGGTSRLARPPSVLPEPDIRPGRGLSIAFTKFTGALFVDSFSEAAVTEEGAVNYYRNGLGGLSTFAPICGESRFSTFSIAGTAAGNALYSNVIQPYVEWPYFYTRRDAPLRTVWKVDLTAGTMSQATADPGSGATNITAITSRPEVGYADYIRGSSSTTAELREWIKALEPSASTSTLAALPSPYNFDHLFLDANENYWLGGGGGWLFLLDALGATIWSVQIPVDSSGTDYLAGLFVPDVIDGGIAFTEQSDGEFDWFHIDSTGAYTDITANVTIDGVPWDTVAPGIFGGPSVRTTQMGDRLGFRIGADFYIGVVSS